MGGQKSKRRYKKFFKRPHIKELAQKFKQSYGVWSQLMELLEQIWFLKLQQLDNYFYCVKLGRVQNRFRLIDKAYLFGIRLPHPKILMYRSRS